MVETQVSDFESFDDIPAEELINISVWEIIINGDIKYSATQKQRKP